MVGGWSDGQCLLEVDAGLGEVARVDQRHAVVIAFLGGAEIDRWLLEAAVAHGDMQLGSLRDVAFSASGGLLEENTRFGKLPRVEECHGRLERGELRGNRGAGSFRFGSGIRML